MEHSRHLQQLAWPQVELVAARPGSTVVWPWGAVEQHGPHLPLGTDGLFAERVLDAVLARLDGELPVLRLPLQSIGFSPEHRGFSGTLSLPPHQLIDQLVAVGHELAAAGFQRLVLFNAHGGQIALLQTAARQLRSERPELAVLPCFLCRSVPPVSMPVWRKPASCCTWPPNWWARTALAMAIGAARFPRGGAWRARPLWRGSPRTSAPPG
jgi:creatinine amidohydrolase